MDSLTYKSDLIQKHIHAKFRPNPVNIYLNLGKR